jgi:hypothetical protein
MEARSEILKKKTSLGSKPKGNRRKQVGSSTALVVQAEQQNDGMQGRSDILKKNAASGWKPTVSKGKPKKKKRKEGDAATLVVQAAAVPTRVVQVVVPQVVSTIRDAVAPVAVEAVVPAVHADVVQQAVSTLMGVVAPVTAEAAVHADIVPWVVSTLVSPKGPTTTTPKEPTATSGDMDNVHLKKCQLEGAMCECSWKDYMELTKTYVTFYMQDWLAALKCKGCGDGFGSDMIYHCRVGFAGIEGQLCDGLVCNECYKKHLLVAKDSNATRSSGRSVKRKRWGHC